MNVMYPKHLDVTPIIINLTDGISEEGDDNIIRNYTGKCIFSSKTRTIRGKDGRDITLLGKAILGCDIAPELPKLTGSVIIGGVTYQIYESSRPRQPGSDAVHHTELELM